MLTKPVVLLVLLLLAGLAVTLAVVTLTKDDEPGPGEGPRRVVRPDDPEIEMPPLMPEPGGPGGSGTVAGRVEGPDGWPMEGARVVLVVAHEPHETTRNFELQMGSGGMRASMAVDARPDESVLAEVTAGSAGTFSFTTDEAGPFSVRASKTGFSSAEAAGVKRGTRDLVLQLGAAGRIAGLVVETGGAPVAGAVVRAGPAKAIADEEGRFAIDDVPVGKVTVTGDANGYEEASIEISVAAGEFAGLADPLTLTPIAGITGRVFDPLGEPLGDVGVSSARGFFEREFGTTDAGGRYHIADLEAGEFTLAFAHGEYLSAKLEALRFEKGGRTIAPDVRMRPGGEIVGKITGPDGRPVAGAQLRAAPAEENMDIGRMILVGMSGPSKLPSSDANGEFRVAGLDTGTYLLSASKQGLLPAVVRDIEVRVPEKTTVEVRLEAGETVAGRVVDREGVPIAGAGVGAVGAMETNNIEEAMLAGASSSQAKTGEDGRFRLTGLADRPVTISVSADGYSGTAVEDVSPGTLDLEVTLARTGKVSGRLIDAETGQPVADGTVSLDDSTSTSVNTAADGTFTVVGVSSGTHELTAYAKGYASGTLRDVTVEEAGETKGLTVELGRGETLTGIVVRASDGMPVAGATVMLSGGAEASSGDTDDDGRFTIQGLANGVHVLTASADGYAETKVANLKVPGTPEVRVALTVGGTIRGIVLDPDGNPVPGRMVMLASGTEFGENVSMTGEDGRFVFEHIAAGTWSLLLLDLKTGGGGIGFDSNAAKATVVEGEEVFVTIGGGADEKKARLRGRLLDRGKPLAGKMIMLFPADLEGESSGIVGLMSRMKMVTTDAEGRYDVADLTPGRYRLMVGMMGGEEMGAGALVEIKKGGEIQQDVELPIGVLSGSVISADDGAALSGAKVMVLDAARAARPAAAIGDLLEMVKAQAIADDKGAFHAPNVDPGKWLIQTVAPGFAPTVMSGVEIREQAGAPLRIRLDRGHEIRVLVQDAGGTPIPGASVILLDQGGRWVVVGNDMNVATGADGVAELRLGSGTWRVVVQAGGHAPVEREIRVDGEAEIPVTVSPGGTLALVATGPAGPVVNGVVRIYGASGREIALRLTEQSMMTGMPSRRTGSDGRVSIENLPAGTLRVSVTGEDGRRGETSVRVIEGSVVEAAVSIK